MCDGVSRVSVGSTSQGSIGALTEDVDEEAVLEWFVEEVANCGPSNCGETTSIREVQVNHS